MAITYFPFNSVMVNGKPDRAANAETLALYLKTFFTDGVVLHSSTALQVKAKTGLTVAIQPGTAFVDGKILHSTSAEEITLDAAEINLDRIDRVIIRLDYINRLIEFDILKGTPASTPTAPALKRDADAYEMCLAEVYISNLVKEITQANITDTRADSNVCGLAAAAIKQIDTSTFYAQYTAQFEEAFSDLNAWTNEQKILIENLIAALQAQGFEKKASYVSGEMLAANWSDGTYSFESIYPFAGYDLEIQPASNATSDQVRAFGGAMMVGSINSNAVTAKGSIPTVDIPIIIKVVAKYD